MSVLNKTYGTSCEMPMSRSKKDLIHFGLQLIHLLLSWPCERPREMPMSALLGCRNLAEPKKPWLSRTIKIFGDGSITSLTRNMSGSWELTSGGFEKNRRSCSSRLWHIIPVSYLQIHGHCTAATTHYPFSTAHMHPILWTSDQRRLPPWVLWGSLCLFQMPHRKHNWWTWSLRYLGWSWYLNKRWSR